MPVTIIGVMPASFEYPLFWETTDIWRPFAFTPDQRQDRRNNYLREFGRLKDGISFEAADANVKELARQLSKEYSEVNPQESLRLEKLNIVDPETRRISMLTIALSALVLFIACFNLANLQLARMITRTREFALRGALGAARMRLLQLSLMESMIVAGLGCALAMPVAYWCTRVIVNWRYSEVPGVNVGLDMTSFGYALACMVLTGLLFGAVPARLAFRSDVNAILQLNSRTARGAGMYRFRYALVIGEVTFALMILTAGISFVRSLEAITSADRGWRSPGLLSASINLAGPNYAAPQQRLAMFEALRERAAAIPGVTHVAFATSSVPTQSFNVTSSFVMEKNEERFMTSNERVSPSYFDAMGMRLLAGRYFENADDAGGLPVVIINEAMASRLWPKEKAVGKSIAFGNSPQLVWREIIGVVNDVTFPNADRTETTMQTYHPMAQNVPVSVGVLLRVENSPESIAPALRRIVAEIDRNVPVYNIRTAERLQRMNTAELRVVSSVVAGFAVVGLLLAAVGVFGVLSYISSQRASELAVRIALGARRGDVLWLVLKQGIVVVIVGAVLGVVGGIGVVRLLASAMPRLPGVDALSLAGAASVVVLVAIAACYVPAHRASMSKPMIVLRHE